MNRRAFLRRAGATAVALGCGTALVGEALSAEEADVQALVAGSLLKVASDVDGANIEAHGSLAVHRLVADGARDPDVVALADPSLFAGLRAEVTDFATNALVLAYNSDSDHVDAIESDWTDALRAPRVRVGRTDPSLDPLGYRTVLGLELAARRDVASTALLDGTDVIPETMLLRALEGGELDAAFAYRSMAVEQGLPYVSFPSFMDFSDPTRADEYASVSLDVGDRVVHGAPIRYAAAPWTDAGKVWCRQLVENHERLRDHGFTVPDAFPTIRDVDAGSTY